MALPRFLLQGIVGKRAGNAHPLCAAFIRFLQEMNFGHTSRTGSSVAAFGHLAAGTLAIITTDADELVAEIHDRMPLILAAADYVLWPARFIEAVSGWANAHVANLDAGQQAGKP